MRSKNGVMKCNELVGRFFSRGILFPATALAVLLSTAGILPAQELVLDNLEGPELVNWNVSHVKWVDGAGRASEKELARISLNTDPQYVKEGKQSLKLDCWAAEEDASYILLGRNFARDPEKKVPLPVTAETDVFSFWIYGKSGEGSLSIRFFGKESKSISAGIPINFTGWRKIILTPSDWIEGGGKAREIWNNLYLFYPVAQGKFEIYLDDMKFVSSAALTPETAAAGFSFSKESQDVIYADLERQDFKGLALKGTSALGGPVTNFDGAKTVIKDLRRSILLPGNANGYSQAWFAAEEGFLPKEGAPILVAFEYYDQGEGKMYWHVQSEGEKILYYTGKGVASHGQSGKGVWPPGHPLSGLCRLGLEAPAPMVQKQVRR